MSKGARKRNKTAASSSPASAPAAPSPDVKPLKHQKRLFVILCAVFAIWMIFLLAMWVFVPSSTPGV